MSAYNPKDVPWFSPINRAQKPIRVIKTEIFNGSTNEVQKSDHIEVCFLSKSVLPTKRMTCYELVTPLQNVKSAALKNKRVFSKTKKSNGLEKFRPKR